MSTEPISNAILNSQVLNSKSILGYFDHDALYSDEDDTLYNDVKDHINQFVEVVDTKILEASSGKKFVL